MLSRHGTRAQRSSEIRRVRGTYGTFPQHLLRGPDDAGDRGYWIPTTAIDQYAATLGCWFGVSDIDLNTIFPNLPRFAPTRLGFV